MAAASGGGVVGGGVVGGGSIALVADSARADAAIVDGKVTCERGSDKGGDTNAAESDVRGVVNSRGFGLG